MALSSLIYVRFAVWLAKTEKKNQILGFMRSDHWFDQ